MSFISPVIYGGDSKNPNAKKLSVNHEFLKLTKEFCNIPAVKACRLATITDMYTKIYFPEEPFFVIGNDLYCAGAIGDSTLTRNASTIQFVIYHMDTQTYTTGTISIPWYDDYCSLETGSSNTGSYVYIQPIKRINNLKFVAFIMSSYYYSSGSSKGRNVEAKASCIVDYAALTATKISNINSSMQNYSNFYTGIQSKVYLTNRGYYLNDSRYGTPWYNHLYMFNINTGTYTEIADKGPCCIYTNTSGVECGFGIYSEAESGYDDMVYYITSEGLSSWNTVDQSRRLKDSWFIHHFRDNLPIFIVPSSSPASAVTYIDSLSRTSVSLRCVGSLGVSEYIGSYPFRNTSSSSEIKGKNSVPSVVDYSQTNVVWSIPLIGSITKTGTIDEYIARISLDKEGIKHD
jgi:hypothetical protein